MIRFYILNGREPVPVTADAWATWFETADRTVATDYISTAAHGVVRISTVFVGLSTSATDLFETIAFCERGPDGEARRYVTYADAEAGHAAVVALVKVGGE